MDNIIKTVRDIKIEDHMGYSKIRIMCYADEAVLVAKIECDLPLHRFYLISQKYNMEILYQ